MLTKCYFPKRTWKSRLTIRYSVALVVCSCAIVGAAQETETDIVSLLQDAAMHSLAGGT